MSLVDERDQSRAPAVEDAARPGDTPDRVFDFSAPFFDSRTATAYVGCKSRRGFYDWCRRHFVVRRSNGTVARAELDRVLRRKRTVWRMHPASLANLRKRKAL